MTWMTWNLGELEEKWAESYREYAGRDEYDVTQ